MRHNGAIRTLLRLIDLVFLSYHLYTAKSWWLRQQSGRYSSPEPPTTTALPQKIPLSPLMRLVAPRVAEAALDGVRPWWMGRRTVRHRSRCFVLYLCECAKKMGGRQGVFEITHSSWPKLSTSGNSSVWEKYNLKEEGMCVWVIKSEVSLCLL